MGSNSIPANPIPDPASLQGQLNSVRDNLKNLGLDTSIADNIYNEIQNRISGVTDNIPQTVSGNYEKIINTLGIMGIDFNPVHNELDKYASYTYHLKFCMTSDAYGQNVKSWQDWKGVPKEVIAESGVTAGFNIRDFEIHNKCSPQERIGIAVETEWKMTLVEPYGLSFIDRLYTLSTTKMGMANHLKGVFFIELWFHGYDDAGNPSGNSIYKLWRVIISEITMDSNTSGSVYHIKGLVDGSLANSNEFSITAAQIVVDDVTTFGEWWKVFKAQLNEQYKKLDYDLPSTRIEYEFVLPQEWLSWKFTRRPQDNASSSGFNIAGPPDKPRITIPRGKGISEILIMVMSMTEEGKKFTMGPPSVGADGEKSGSKADAEGIVYIPLIQTKVEFTGYSYFFNDYVRKATFYFSPYPTVRGFKNREFIKNSEKAPVQRQRLTSFVNDARLKKVYNYQFTGLNTDVLKFDIKLDNYWTALQPLFDGYNNSATWSLGPSVPGESVPQTILSNYKRQQQEVSDARVKLESLTKLDELAKGTDFAKKLEEAENLLKQAQEKLKGFLDQINLADFEIKFGNLSAGEKSIAGIIINNVSLLTDKKIREDFMSRVIYNLTRSAAQDRYLETVQPQDPSTNPLPISTHISNQPTQQNNSTGGILLSDPLSTAPVSPPKSRGLLASIIDNVTGPQFARIDLEIRGDPYWLGIDNIENLQYLDPNTPAPKTKGVSNALFANGECAFLLFFRTGEEPNEATGIVEFNSSSWAFNGLYVVISVDNYFRDGKFTQTLHAVKDAALYSVWNDLTPGDLLKAGLAPV